MVCLGMILCILFHDLLDSKFANGVPDSLGPK